MMQRIGTCSLCDGDVMGYHGAWGSIFRPPPPTCAQCGAVARRGDVIRMTPAPRTFPHRFRTIITDHTNTEGQP